MQVAGIIILSLYLILYLYFSYKSGNFKRAIASSSLWGITALAAIHIVGTTLNFSLPLNIYTLGISALTGLPGVLLITLLSFIII